MLKIARNDLYRLRKTKLFYFFILFTGFISLLLMILNRQDIRLGISVFGNLTTFITANDIIKIGIEYQKGLGIVVAVLVSVFVGQEYLWNTWQHKWLISKSRIGMYLSKAMLVSLTAIAIFLFYEVIALLFSGQMKELFTIEYIASLICGNFLYASLGATNSRYDIRLDALYDTMVELEERIEDAKLRRCSIEMEAITLENVYKIMQNFGKLYAIMSDEEKKSLITYLIKEIQIYPNGESEMPLKSIEFNFPIYIDGR